MFYEGLVFPRCWGLVGEVIQIWWTFTVDKFTKLVYCLMCVWVLPCLLLPWLACVPCALAASIWDLHVGLVRANDEQETTTAETSSFSKHFFLVLREPRFNQCRWTKAIYVTAGAAERGITVDVLKGIQKCGPAMYAHRCTFVSASWIQSRPAFAAVFGRKVPGYLGFLLMHLWTSYNDSGCPEWMMKEVDSFVVFPHPYRPLHQNPGIWGHWLKRSLRYGSLTGLSESENMSTWQLMSTAMEEMPNICPGRVQHQWGSLWPELRPPKSMVILGCGALANEPTQPLLDKGAGGLFVDAGQDSINLAKQHSAPHRMILHEKVTPHGVAALLRKYSSYVQDVEVLQIDVDSIDGPLVEELLRHTQPRAVVVEIRDMIPFPFRYSCLTSFTKNLQWGGSNLAFWLKLFHQHGLHLAKMDHLDAVFIKMPPPSVNKFLGILACYLKNFVLDPSPIELIGEEELPPQTMTRHKWLVAQPEMIIEDIWRNLTAVSGEVRFYLNLWPGSH